MPSHNSASFIDDTIRSVIAQTYPHWELIVVDDCSRDDTLSITRALAAQEPRIRSIALQENGGAAVARNTAIEAAQGRWIAFLDSDDLWTPDKLEKQIAFMEATGSAFSYASYERITEAGTFISTVHVSSKVSYHQLLKNNIIACLTAVYDTKQLGKVFMPMIRKGQDYGLWLILLKRTGQAHGIDKVLGRYRVREFSISSNKLESSTWVWKIYREVMHLNLPTTLYYFSWYAATGVLRRIGEKLGRKTG
ncbi:MULTISPECIES: glycosyltransferase family 2 protein [Sphingomonas]|nr:MULTISPECIES: glycosyltransferase [unclassified Sphingomonas]